MSGLKVVSVSLFALLVLVFLAASLGAVSAKPAASGQNAPSFEVFKGIIVSVNEESIVVKKGDEALNLLSSGHWIIISDKLTKASWPEAKTYIEIGESTIVSAHIEREDETINVLAGIKQEDTLLIKPLLLKHWAEKRVHERSYLSVRGQIVAEGDNYIVIERNGLRGLAIVDGMWWKAGEGKVMWEEVADEFSVGDDVRIFYHNILVMNEDFYETFEIKAFIRGYSGAIINLTSGTTLSKAGV